MISTRCKYHVWFLFILSLLFGFLQAGGPNVLEKNGKVYSWDVSRPVPFAVDQGFLGVFTEEESLALVRESFDKWAEISTAAIEFQEGARLDQNITVDNYRDFFGFGEDQEMEVRPGNPVIFDDGGEIIEDFLGVGSSDYVMGFAGIRKMDHNNREFLSGWVVLNGSNYATNYLGYSVIGGIVSHELGHLIGLDHSQGLPENFNETEWQSQMPLMYPITTLEGPKGPTHDDAAWASWLYPTAEFANQDETGTIRGRVLRPTGEPLLGANVIARGIADGELSRSGVTSVASGFLMFERGEFELPGLVPGDYVVCIEPLKALFTGGSGVGPYDVRPADFPRDYYDADESSSEDPYGMEIITVAAGETKDGLLIIANEYPREPDSLGDDDEILYSFPEGFSFPFYGKTYRSVYLSSDGILSFTTGDRPDGSRRTESRFLGESPRIAPLYCDLDPGAVSAEIRIEEGYSGENITFHWDQVPEFSVPEAVEGNTFSVTLFRNGDIDISYGDINITPDSSSVYEEGLNAIVGISPGGLESATPLDLSGDNYYETENGKPIYEAFPGYSFDLDNSSLRFNAAWSQIIFPYVKSTDQDFTGFALFNFGEDTAAFDVEARDSEGVLTDELSFNPAQYDLGSGVQFALLGREIFQAPAESLDELSQSWLRFISLNPEMGSLFQVGDGIGPGARQSRMDGAIGVTSPSTELYFTRLYNGDSAYPVQSGMSAVPAVTKLSIVNPEDREIEVVFGLYGPDGDLAVSEVTADIAALGVLRVTLDELFDISGLDISDGYLKAEASGSGIAGFEFIEIGDTYIGLNAGTPSRDRILYSAQLAHHQTIYTNVKIVNTTDEEIGFLLKAYLVSESSGTDEVTSARIILSPNQSFQQNAGDIFDLPEDPDRIIVGSIQVIADKAGLAGDVIFGDPLAASYASALSFQDSLFKRAVYSHISNGEYPGDSTRDAFTGVAVFNPGALDSALEITAYDRDGVKAGEFLSNLEPGGRFSLTLTEMIPETDGMAGGFVIIESSAPVVAQQLFGNRVLDYLSAVPPVIIE